MGPHAPPLRGSLLPEGADSAGGGPSPDRMSPAVIEAIERNTVQAVAPERVDEGLPGWLLPMDRGTVGRAQCAAPLSHAAPDPALIDTIAERYRANGFSVAWRLPELPEWDAFTRALGERGFVRTQPTQTHIAEAAELLRRLPGPPQGIELRLTDTPDAAWLAMFLGEGLDPVDGASRSRALSRAVGTRFASLSEAGQTLACGAASFSHGWLGVHGMRTAARQRGRGLAGMVLRAMAGEALRRGIPRVFLQVTADNTAALALYQRAGFQLAWPYAYWRR
jgi:GNAT superfamily N-acetyltransferase